jgi:two-component system sensor histidine kinase/response regulator
MEILMEKVSHFLIMGDEPINLLDIVEALPGYIYWKNVHSQYMGCNKNLASVSGLKQCSDIAGKKDEDFGWGAEQAESFRQDDQEVMRTGQIKITEHILPIPTVDSSYMYVRTEKIPLYNQQGKVVGILGVALDITDRKRAEEALKEAKERAEVANQAKSQFLSVTSHELRLPLSAILGMTDFLLTDDLTVQERQEYLNSISTAGAHLLSLINDILDFAKLEADKFELAPAELDLKRLVEEVSTLMAAQTKLKGLDLWVNYEPTVPHLILGDSRALRQIIVNLVGNAIKFTETGHIAINVRCLEQSPTHAKLELSIEDTGIGIPKDKLGIIFERFQQVDSSYSRAYGGTGLGLAITKKLLELMNSTVNVTSELGKGTTFSCMIEFPLQEGAISSSPWTAYQAKVRILVVSNSLKGEIIGKHLGVTSCQTISSPKEVLNTLITAQRLHEPYDIVIVDKKLYNPTEFNLINVLQKHKKLRTPMCLLLTSSASLKEREEIKALGFYDFIIEPIQPLNVQTTLTTAWQRWSEEQQMRQEKRRSLIKLHVLLVEDDKMIQFIHKRILMKLGCQVTIAESGKEALQMLNNSYDIVFMDMGLPDIAGPDILKEFRNVESAGQHTPIIAVTGFGAEHDLQVFLEAGADEVLVKPVKREKFQRKLEECFSSKP